MDNKPPKIKILVACHKADPNIRQDDIYMPIQVGAALHPELDLGFQKDNEGENISPQNPSYCELTALYWAWKNLPKDIEYVGLAHYRRYFEEKVTQDYIVSKLKIHDILIPYPDKLDHSNLESLYRFIGMEDTFIMIDTILELYPEMKYAILKYFYNSNKLSVFNMFIMKRDDFENYAKFLFPLLDSISKRLKGHNYTRPSRNLGYMAESLLGFYIIHNHLKTKKVKPKLLHSRLSKKGQLLLTTKKFIRDLTFKLNHFYPKFKDVTMWEAIRIGLNSDGIYLPNIK